MEFSFKQPIQRDPHLKLLNFKHGGVRRHQSDDLLGGAVDRQDRRVLVRPAEENGSLVSLAVSPDQSTQAR